MDKQEGRNAAPPEGALAVFNYVTAEKAWLYRRIMGFFGGAKSRFVLHLRPAEVATALAGAHDAPGPDAIEVERALSQLCDWGNLDRHLDLSEVATVEEFNRPRYLYQITREGEAAERALRTFQETVQQPGELQATALSDIRDLLGELEPLASMQEPDAGKTVQTLHALVGRFDQLTSRAQTFIAGIQPSVQLQAAELTAFVAYKRMLIEYLERFIQELVVQTVEIVRALERVENAGIDRLLAMAAARELVDALEPTEAQQREAVDAWQQRWGGLRRWFIGEGAGRSQAEELRAHARSAIPSLLRAVSTIHDRRLQRSDRVADLKTLARWFATSPDENAAARLWRAAFALSPARHLRVTEETLDLWDQESVPSSRSWFDAPPIRIAPRLRRTGYIRRRGRPNGVIDRSAERGRLAALAAEQARQIEGARRQLITGDPVPLSAMGPLETGAFELFLGLLGEALARKRSDDQAVEAQSIDGATVIRLQPMPAGTQAVLHTDGGVFRGRDHWVHIRPAVEPDPPGVPSREAPR